MSTSEPQQPSEEELRAAYEAEIRKIRVEHVLLEHVVTLVNLGMRRTGLMPGTEPERDLDQVRLAIEGVRATLPLVEGVAPEQVGPIRDALSQLQMAYVRGGGQPPAEGDDPPGSTPPPSGAAGSGGGAEPGGTEPAPGAAPGGSGPAQRSGRLWVPGQ
jgi:hypothetical protein